MLRGLVCVMREGLWRVAFILANEAIVIVILAVGPSDEPLDSASEAAACIPHR